MSYTKEYVMRRIKKMNREVLNEFCAQILSREVNPRIVTDTLQKMQNASAAKRWWEGQNQLAKLTDKINQMTSKQKQSAKGQEMIKQFHKIYDRLETDSQYSDIREQLDSLLKKEENDAKKMD